MSTPPTAGQRNWAAALLEYIGAPSAPVTISGDDGTVTAFEVADEAMYGTDPRVELDGTMIIPDYLANRVVTNISATGLGNVGQVGIGMVGLQVEMKDHATVVNKTVTGCANNGSGLIRVHCVGHGFFTDQWILIYGVVGTTEANLGWLINVIDADHFDLVRNQAGAASAFSNAYVSGGVATNRPLIVGIYVPCSPSLRRGVSGALADAEDMTGIAVQNTGAGKATDAVYVAESGTLVGQSWDNAFASAADVGRGLDIGGTVRDAGIDFTSATIAAGVPHMVMNTGSAIYAGSGSPNGVVTANNGSLYLNSAGGAGTSLYVKESGGFSNTGWVGK